MEQLKKSLAVRMPVRELVPLERLLVKAVLENTIDQLAIVSGTLQHFMNQSQHQLHGTLQAAANEIVHWNVSDKSLEELLLREHRTRQKIKPGGLKEKFEKVISLRLLVTEADYTIGVLENTLEEVLEDGSYFALTDSVHKSRKRNKEKVQIGEAEEEARNDQNELKDSIERTKINSERSLRRASMEIARLKDDLLESRRVTRGEEIFIEKLEVINFALRFLRMMNSNDNVSQRTTEGKNKNNRKKLCFVELQPCVNDFYPFPHCYTKLFEI